MPRYTLALVSQLAAQLRHRLQQRQTMLDEHPPSCRGRQSTCMALKQRIAQRGFEFAQAPTGSCQGQIRLAGSGA